MSEQLVDGCEDKSKSQTIVDVITIDDDEEVYVDDEEDEEEEDSETDDIQVIEVIRNQLNSNKDIPPQLTPNGLNSDHSSDEEYKTCNTCVQTNVEKSLNELSVDSDVEPKSESKEEPKGVKRVAFITISPSTSKESEDNANIESSDPTPPKVQRLSTPTSPPKAGTSNSKPEKPKIDFQTLYENYLKSFTDRLNSLSANESQTQVLGQKFTEVFNKLKTMNTKFLNSKQFEKLMTVWTKEVLELDAEHRLVGHHNDLLIELNRFTQAVKSAAKGKKLNAKVKALTAQLKKIQREIVKSEDEVLDYEAMTRNSRFTELPKLYRKAEEIWTKREQLMSRSTNTGRSFFKRLKYNKSLNPVIDRCVENLFNAYMKRLKSKKRKGYVDESFTFIDVRKAILDEIKLKDIVVSDVEDIVLAVYKDLIEELRSRRQKESEEVFETLETDDDLRPETFVANDPQIDIEIAKNANYFQKKLNDLYYKFATEDKKINGEKVFDGRSEWDSALVDEDNYESLDVKDGDLEEEEPEEENSDEDIGVCDTSLPDFTTTLPPGAATAQVVSDTTPTTPIVSDTAPAAQVTKLVETLPNPVANSADNCPNVIIID